MMSEKSKMFSIIKLIFAGLGILSISVVAAQDNAQKPKDTIPKTEMNVQPQGDENPQDAGAQTGEADSQNVPPPTINAPGVNTATTSSSGSPAIRSENDGEERDGTNNVQRATLNIAGSPVPGLRNESTETSKSKKDNDKEQEE